MGAGEVPQDADAALPLQGPGDRGAAVVGMRLQHEEEGFGILAGPALMGDPEGPRRQRPPSRGPQGEVHPARPPVREKEAVAGRGVDAGLGPPAGAEQEVGGGGGGAGASRGQRGGEDEGRKPGYGHGGGG